MNYRREGCQASDRSSRLCFNFLCQSVKPVDIFEERLKYLNICKLDTTRDYFQLCYPNQVFSESTADRIINTALLKETLSCNTKKFKVST